MKKLFYSLALVVMFAMIVSCAKFPEDQIAPTNGDAYQLKSAKASMSGDTIIGYVNTLMVFDFEKLGVKIAADFDFRNGSPIQSSTTATGYLVTTKFANPGIYLVSGTDLNVTPNEKRTRIVKIIKENVVPASETAIIVISSSFTSAGVNTMTLGLRCNAIGGFDPLAPVAAQVQYEMKPSVSWTTDNLPVSSITTVNGIKYYSWTFTCLNNQKIRFGWLVGDSWAYDSKSVFRQADGLYAAYVKDGKLAKEIITSLLPGVFGDVKVRGDVEVVSGSQNLVLYFQKLAFSGGTPTLKYKVGTSTTEQTVNLTDAGDYFVAKVAMLNTEEIQFWPVSTVGNVNITDSVVWSPEKLCGRIQIINLKSATIGAINKPSVILG